MKNLSAIVLILVFCLLLGCQDQNKPSNTDISTSPTSSAQQENSNIANTELPTIPAVDTFSGTELQLEKQYGAVIHSAQLTINKNQASIAPDDPRLISLLNFITYSEEHQLTTWLHHYIENDEILTYLSSDVPMLDITMVQAPTAGSFLSDSSRILVCKDRYLLFLDEGEGPPDRIGMLAEEFYPFGVYIMNQDGYAFGSSWGQDGWIDLLKAFGFV